MVIEIAENGAKNWVNFRLEGLCDEGVWESFFTLTPQSFASQLRFSWFRIVKTILGPSRQLDMSVGLEVRPTIGLYPFPFGIPDLQCIAIEPHPW